MERAGKEAGSLLTLQQRWSHFNRAPSLSQYDQQDYSGFQGDGGGSGRGTGSSLAGLGHSLHKSPEGPPRARPAERGHGGEGAGQRRAGGQGKEGEDPGAPAQGGEDQAGREAPLRRRGVGRGGTGLGWHQDTVAGLQSCREALLELGSSSSWSPKCFHDRSLLGTTTAGS